MYVYRIHAMMMKYPQGGCVLIDFSPKKQKKTQELIKLTEKEVTANMEPEQRRYCKENGITFCTAAV